MKPSLQGLAFASTLLFFPALGNAQSMGRVECPRNDGYVYLYSSISTLDVRSTLQCGEQVEITGRFDNYYGVQTKKGEVGFVPLNSIFVLKDKPGPANSKAAADHPARERIAYDNRNAHSEPDPKNADKGAAAGFTLLNGTTIRLKLSKTISSATARVGDPVELEVTEEVTVDGVPVIPKGASAAGTVTDVEPKKRMGRGGKLGVSVTSVRLGNNGKAPVRSYQESTGSSSAAFPLSSGKDVIFEQGTEFIAYVDGDVHLKRESFQPAKNGNAAAPATTP